MLSLTRAAALAGMTLAVLLLARLLPLTQVLAAAQHWIDGLGAAGPLALGVLYVFAALLFVPGSLLTLAAGAIYGLVLGTIIVSVAATTSAAVAFLIARYVARDRVRRLIAQSPKLTAVDAAIGAEGWKIVALLRLSPAVPFNLQNYLYGVTAVRFWPAVAASWIAMLPGTFLYVYLGAIGRTAASGSATSPLEWALRGVGLGATVVVTIYVARLARRAIRERTGIDAAPEEAAEASTQPVGTEPRPVRTLLLAAVAATMLVVAVWATLNEGAVRPLLARRLVAGVAVEAPSAGAATSR